MFDQPSLPRLPLSPASPPESGLKSQSESHVAILAPHTPPHTDQMSVATKRYVPFSHDGRHTNEMASRSPDGYTNQAQRSSISSPPPANNLKRPLPQDDEQLQASKRQKTSETENAMEIETSIAATNHDRENESQPSSGMRAGVSFDERLNVQEIPQIDKAKLDSTFQDVGPALLIGKTSKAYLPLPFNMNSLNWMLMLSRSS